MINNTEHIRRLHSIRRLIKGLLPFLELELGEYDPICKQCFHEKGLVDTCECKDK